MLLKIVVSLFVLLNCACATLSVDRYSTSARNVSQMRKLPSRSINVGKFDDAMNRKTIGCRAVTLQPPGGGTFADYIQQALVTDLMMAGNHDDKSAFTLKGTLDKLELKSGSGAFWELGITVSSSNGKSLPVTEVLKFESAFDADTACRNATHAFGEAVQNLIHKLINDPQFNQLVE